MLSEKVTNVLQEQINKELFSAYLYLDFAGFYTKSGLNGFASWYVKQAKEEFEHAEKIISYLVDNGIRPIYEAIDKPNEKLENIEDPLHAGLRHEQYVTESINTCYKTADMEKDYRTMQFLDWFVKEQLEEEKNAEDLLDQYAFAKDSKAALYMMNADLGNRK